MENDDSLNKEIEKKIKGWKRTRYNRINFSKRLKKYSDRWGTLIFFMNTLAIVFLIFSLKLPSSNKINEVVAGCYSIYIILLQDFISNKDYNARSLKLHYEQLEIEDCRNKLKDILDENDDNIEDKKRKYCSILEQYQISLKNNENHDDFDDNQTEKDIGGEKFKGKDYTLDNILIFINACVFCAMLILAFVLYK